MFIINFIEILVILIENNNLVLHVCMTDSVDRRGIIDEDHLHEGSHFNYPLTKKSE